MVDASPTSSSAHPQHFIHFAFVYSLPCYCCCCCCCSCCFRILLCGFVAVAVAIAVAVRLSHLQQTSIKLATASQIRFAQCNAIFSLTFARDVDVGLCAAPYPHCVCLSLYCIVCASVDDIIIMKFDWITLQRTLNAKR